MILKEVEKILELTLVNSKYLTISFVDIVRIIVILALMRFALYLFSRFIKRRVAKGNIEEGKGYAITQIVSYFLYVIITVIILQNIGVKITVLLAGSTALFVGLGLGLQDTFKDFVSGIIILMERTITVGDIVEIDGSVGKVRDVGLRTTTLLTRDEIEVIIPNKRLTGERVINWSRSGKISRFAIGVGVAYGSDTALVKKILLEVAGQFKEVAKTPEPSVHFADFGESSLNFKLLFFTRNLFRIERLKSDIRFKIDEAFRKNGIAIPFPQRDVWIRQQPGSEK
jgi:small-conductance mechanosensitive channel